MKKTKTLAAPPAPPASEESATAKARRMLDRVIDEAFAKAEYTAVIQACKALVEIETAGASSKTKANGTPLQTATWTSTQLKSLPIRGQVQAYVGAKWNLSMSVAATISDTPGTAMTNGAGMRFAALALELQNLGARYPLTPAGARR